MTASPPPPPPPPPTSPSADDLASAYVDGEVTAVERAQIETDPTLLARVDELRMVRETLAASVDGLVAAPGERDAAIRAATDAASRAPGGATDDAAARPGPEAPIDLSARRRGLGRSGRIGLAVLGAVAAAAIAVVTINTTRTGNDTPSTARLAPAAASAPAVPTVAGANPASNAAGGAATSVASAATTAAASGATDVAAPGADASRAAVTAGVPALGAIDDGGALRTALAAAPAPLAAAEAAAAADEPCAVAGGQLVATVVWQGTLAFVYVDGARSAEVVSQDDCAALAEVPLS